MRWFRTGVAIGVVVAAAAVSCTAPAAASATTLFSNITGPPTVPSGTSGESFASNFWVAKKFSPTTTGTANLISFWVQCFSGGTCTPNGGSTSGTIQLYTDNNGVPGTALGQPATFSAPPFNGGTPDCVVTSSSPTITAGTQYWAVMKTASPNDGISWEFQDTNADTVEDSTNGGMSWSPLTQQGSNTDRDLSLRIDTGTSCTAHMLPNPTAGTTIGGMYPRSGHHSFDTITIGNDGLATLNLTSYTIIETDSTGQTPFTLLNGQPDGMPPGATYPQQSQVFPGGTAILYTTCTGPTQENHYTATLTITTDDPTQPSISWPLSCFVDNTPPKITISATPDGNHGWFKTNPALVGVIADDGVNGSGTNGLSCTNNGVRVVSVPASGASFNATTEGDNNISCTASDVAGNVTPTPTTADVKIDSRPPVISPAVTPAPNAAGWNNSAVTVGFACADPTPGSGIDTNTVGGGGLFTAETPKAGQVVSNTGTCTDIAGNTAAGQSVTLKIDETPPTTSVSGGPPARTNRTSASFLLSGNDALSGVAGFQCSLDGAAPTPCSATPSYSNLAAGQTHTFTAQAIDVAGNVDGIGVSTSWFVDNTPPSVEFDSPAANATVGTNGQISFHATDPDDASGFSYTCQLDGGTVSPCSSPYTYSGLTSGANPHTLVVTASDVATNTGSASVTFNIAAPPMVQTSFGAASIPLHGSTVLSLQLMNPNSGVGLSGISVSDALPAGLVVSTPNGESNTCGGNVSADAGSSSIGLTGATLPASGACTLTVNVTGTAAGTQDDMTGDVASTESGTGAPSNTATVTVIAPPSVTITAPADGATYSVGQSVDTSYSCTEGASGPGIGTCSDDHSVGNGNAIDTSTPGSFSLTVTATSKDGQSTAKTVTYTVAGGPSAAITAPADGANYSVGETVDTSYSCTDGSFGPGIATCSDDHSIGNGNAIDTSTPGSFSLKVTATSKDGQSAAKTVSYTVAGPPSVTITTPPNGAHYIQGQTVNVSYSCTDGSFGPGISSCTDNHSIGNGNPIDTSTPGSFSLKVTATSKDGQSAAKTVSYTVAGPPSATITAPANGVTYSVGASVSASYSCQDDPNGPGIQSCAGPVANGAAIDTSTPGNFSLKVTATSKDTLTGSKTVSYTVAGPPSVTSTTPPGGGGHYFQGQRVIASYSCTDGAFGPGIDSCTDDHSIGNGNPIDTSTPGRFTLKLTATSKDGQSTAKTLTYTVAGPPAAAITTPADSAHYIERQRVTASYSCIDSAFGPGIASCTDDNRIGNGNPIDTSTLGQHSFTVTGTSKDGLTTTVTHHYTVLAIGAPTAKITSPADNRTFTHGHHAATRFSCAEGTGGPGIKSCTDSNGARGAAGQLDTSHIGTFAYTVRATSGDGLTATMTIHYNVVPGSTNFRVTRVKVHPNGIVTFDVIVPTAGVVKVIESASKHDEEPLAAAAALLEPAPGRFAFARAHLVVPAPGMFHMRLAPTKRGKQLIAHHRHLVRIRLWVTFTPPNGHVLQIGFYGLSVNR